MSSDVVMPTMKGRRRFARAQTSPFTADLFISGYAGSSAKVDRLLNVYFWPSLLGQRGPKTVRDVMNGNRSFRCAACVRARPCPEKRSILIVEDEPLLR